MTGNLTTNRVVLAAFAAVAAGVCGEVAQLSIAWRLLLSVGLILLVGTDVLAMSAHLIRRYWLECRSFFVLAALTGTAALLLALGIAPRLRRLALGSLVAQALLFTLFLNVYLLRVAPHWGQRETVLQYYLTRAGPEEPLVAYQLNWKGENFYTGNRLPAFVQTGQAFREWLDEQKNSGTRVVYFTTEHVRQNVLKNELGLVKRFQVLTKPSLNNKFFLARVEL